METTNHKQSNPAAASSLKDYHLLANLFIYPENDNYGKKIKEVYQYLQRELPEAAEAIRPFVRYTAISSFREMQELFLRSFDLQAITTLDIGFILFGEDYKRGKLLVHLNEEHKNAGNDCQTELADHLPNLLRLLPKIKDAAMQFEIATLLIEPAVVKMIKEFSPQKIEAKDTVYKKHQKVVLEYSQNHRTIYQSCLQALFEALKSDFGYIPQQEVSMNKRAAYADPNNPASAGSVPGEKDFSQHIETEMLTEK